MEHPIFLDTVDYLKSHGKSHKHPAYKENFNIIIDRQKEVSDLDPPLASCYPTCGFRYNNSFRSLLNKLPAYSLLT